MCWGHRRGQQSLYLTPEQARGQGQLPSQPWWEVIGGVLVLARAALMGEAPGSQQGWNKEGESEGRRAAEEEEEESPWNAESLGE